MFVDLHAHYPMHLPLDGSSNALALMATVRRAGWWEATGALVLKIANHLANYPRPAEPAITIPNLRAGGVGIALSVLTVPFEEIDLRKRYGASPDPACFDILQRHLEAVEKDVARNYAAVAAVAHDGDELADILAAGKLALVHAVEGGFHLGDTPGRIRENVRRLAEWGVAYVTLAHLFWRQVATNAPAIPFLSDRLYRRLFPQPPVGLTPLGREAVRAMVEQRILIDVTHMSRLSLDDTFSLLDEIDPAGAVPVMASHSAYRFGKLGYNLTGPHIAQIARRGGVIGLIFCDHYMSDGLRRGTKTFAQTMDVICRHIDKLFQLTGTHAHTALGSDLDGFIRPVLAGLETPASLPHLRDVLSRRYGDDIAEQICGGNAQRVLGWWARKPAGSTLRGQR